MSRARPKNMVGPLPKNRVERQLGYKEEEVSPPRCVKCNEAVRPGKGDPCACTRALTDGYVYAFQVGTYESRRFYTDAPDRERAIRRADRWARLFWTRFVADLALKHSGSIAHAICADGANLIVYEHRSQFAGLTRSGAWTRIHERKMPVIERP